MASRVTPQKSGSKAQPTTPGVKQRPQTSTPGSTTKKREDTSLTPNKTPHSTVAGRRAQQMVDHSMLLKALKERDLEIEKYRALAAIQINQNYSRADADK